MSHQVASKQQVLRGGTALLKDEAVMDVSFQTSGSDEHQLAQYQRSSLRTYGSDERQLAQYQRGSSCEKRVVT